MKTTKLFVAAIALLSVLSCQKEAQENIINPDIKGGQLITCGFANNDDATRTTLGEDGLTPYWAEGDRIKLYDEDSQAQELILSKSGEPSSEKGIIDCEDSTKFTFAKPDGWEEVYAIYPSSACVSGFDSGNAKLNFAGQDGSFAKANICAAAEVSDTMSFKNVGAILKFTSKSVKATKVVVPVAGLANNFKVTFSGTTPSLVSESASNSNEFSIGTGSGAVYIGIPAESIAASSVFTYKTSADATLGTYTTGAANTVEANKLYNLGAMMGTLSGLFTIDGSGNKVQFSKGNLQATVDASGTPSAWNFAADQFGYIGNAVANNSIGTTAGVVDLFGWSTNATSNNWGIHTKTSATTGWTDDNFKDWSANAIANGGNTANQWRTLSSAEWTYLLNTRSVNGGTGEGNGYQRATVNSVYGMIIYPDSYTAQTTATSYTSAQWSTMESAGCVFLPAAGRRNGSDVYDVGSVGYYWSSTPNGTNYAYRLYFYSSDVIPADNYYRYNGLSVRLVCAAQ